MGSRESSGGCSCDPPAGVSERVCSAQGRKLEHEHGPLMARLQVSNLYYTDFGVFILIVPGWAEQVCLLSSVESLQVSISAGLIVQWYC